MEQQGRSQASGKALLAGLRPVSLRAEFDQLRPAAMTSSRALQAAWPVLAGPDGRGRRVTGNALGYSDGRVQPDQAPAALCV